MLKVIEWPIYILLIDCEGFNEGFFSCVALYKTE